MECCIGEGEELKDLMCEKEIWIGVLMGIFEWELKIWRGLEEEKWGIRRVYGIFWVCVGDSMLESYNYKRDLKYVQN